MTSRLIKPEEDHLLPTEFNFGLVRPLKTSFSPIGTRADKTDSLGG
jgi:hypothetical protein